MLASLGLCAGYVIGDATDVLPGPLTFSAVERRTFADARLVRAGTPVVGQADDSRAIDRTAASKLISQLLATKGVGKEVTVAIAQADGTIVASQDADTPREPASTLKTLTALAAASVLDMGSTLDTQTYFVQESDGENLLILKGNGDMLLGAGESDTAHVNGRAGLLTLAKESAKALKARGITKVTLAYDDSLFGEERYPSRINERNDGNLYYTGVSSMAVDGGRQRAMVLADPDSFEDYPTLSQHTAADIAATFRTLLAKQGITVANATAQQTEAPASRTPLASVSSAPLSAVMAFMLQHSDNTLAEEFGRLLALHQGTGNSPEGATKAVMAQLDTLGVNTEGLAMGDCSGLGPGSKVSAATLVDVQRRNLDPSIAPAAAEGLSVAGLVGTARTRLADADAAGLLRVKTGSLGTVTSMAGNVSRAKGGTAAFAVVVNDPTDMAAAREAINQFVAAIVDL
ncbi:MAG: D-alanyl-D-alanine carboxypeptidase/D-alanyl-D-alanine-endopeptidase [Bifidobacterium sp.]|nr:D-alanyl-D-alanine carboxypeptidase/D-alanyl-D-alanine-endopeptidase [Bifidobacterium sp.]